ncbi:hypothetical protein BCCGELA001_30145 [Bradyrhizobium sp. CCGE-LA001]|nr:hypothetical protein BCCGELA001_30145 [Bradyrhizobium sp. CCGE-LA001]
MAPRDVVAAQPRSEVLILDEANASLDSVAEAFVIRAIEELRLAGKIIVVISHRPTRFAEPIRSSCWIRDVLLRREGMLIC